MTEEIENEEGERRDVKEREAEGPRGGERLAAARREQQISILEIAKELHLDEPKVRALEQNNFDILGAPVFAKGHLRKYASLVNVDIDDVLQDYYRLNRSAGMPPVVGNVRKPIRDFSPGRWIITIVLLMIAAAAYWWFANYYDAGPAPRSSVAEPQEAAVSDGEIIEENVEPPAPVDAAEFDTVDIDLPDTTVTMEPPVTQTTLADAPPVDAPPTEAVAEAVADTVSAPDIAAGQVRVTMRFSGDCWTEISDASGRRLYFDLGREGRSATVSGDAPLSVLFGNAANVSLQVNGADYSISASDLRGETARLTIRNP